MVSPSVTKYKVFPSNLESLKGSVVKTGPKITANSSLNIENLNTAMSSNPLIKNIFGLSLFSVLLKSILLKKLGYADDLQIEEIANINLMIYHETELFAILDEIQLVQNKIRQNFNIQITLERFMLYLQEV